MPNRGLCLVSLLCVGFTVLMFLFPNVVAGANRLLNRTVAALDEPLLRYRYVLGVLLAVAAYCVFRLAVLLPNS